MNQHDFFHYTTAPSLQQLLHMPWVSAVGEASRCATYLYGAFRKYLFETTQFILMMCITLTFSSLLQEEWSVTIRSSHGLCHKGGVAICYKQNLPEVLRRVNYTLEPTAVLLSQEPLTLGLRVATLLKLCMAPFESDWKMDPSRLQSLNDSSAKWDSVIQFAWNLHAQIRGQVSIRLRMARRHDHRCHDCPAFAETTACWWFFRDCAKNCGRNSRGNFSSSLRCCWHKQMQFSTSFMTVNTFAPTWNCCGCLKTLLWIERSCIERKQVFSESHSRMRLYNPDLLWGLCRKMPSRNLLLKSTLLTFLASAGGSYMASQAMQGQFQYMQS